MGGITSKSKDGGGADDKGKNLRKDLPIVAHEFSLEVRSGRDERELVVVVGRCQRSTWRRRTGAQHPGQSKGRRAWRGALPLCSPLGTVAAIPPVGTPDLGHVFHLLPTPHPRLRPDHTPLHRQPPQPPIDPQELAAEYNVSFRDGLTGQQVVDSRKKHGENRLTPPSIKPWWWVRGPRGGPGGARGKRGACGRPKVALPGEGAQARRTVSRARNAASVIVHTAVSRILSARAWPHHHHATTLTWLPTDLQCHATWVSPIAWYPPQGAVLGAVQQLLLAAADCRRRAVLHRVRHRPVRRLQPVPGRGAHRGGVHIVHLRLLPRSKVASEATDVLRSHSWPWCGGKDSIACSEGNGDQASGVRIRWRGRGRTGLGCGCCAVPRG